jgi:hypothetical protein
VGSQLLNWTWPNAAVEKTYYRIDKASIRLRIPDGEPAHQNQAMSRFSSQYRRKRVYCQALMAASQRAAFP